MEFGTESHQCEQGLSVTLHKVIEQVSVLLETSIDTCTDVFQVAPPPVFRLKRNFEIVRDQIKSRNFDVNEGRGLVFEVCSLNVLVGLFLLLMGVWL